MSEITPPQSDSTPPQIRKKFTFGMFVLWLVGIMFFISSFNSLGEQPFLATAAIFVIGLIALPPVHGVLRRFIKDKWVRGLVSVLAMFAFAALATYSQNKEKELQAELRAIKQAAEEKERLYLDSAAQAIADQYYFVKHYQARAWLQNSGDSLENPQHTFSTFLDTALVVHQRDSIQHFQDSVADHLAMVQARKDSIKHVQDSVRAYKQRLAEQERLRREANRPINPEGISMRCRAFTQKGPQCKRMTKNTSGYCWQHER